MLKKQYKAFGAVSLATVLGGIMLASSAQAAQFGVRVVDADGMPVTGASVCFGLPGNYRQFGTRFTDNSGQATADVPNIPFVVTVSKTRFSAVRMNEPARGFNLIKQVSLVEGTPGPRCKGGSTLVDSGSSSVRIENVDVASRGNSVVLTPSATGEPTEYRVSSTPDTGVAKWQSLGDSITLTGEFAQQGEVYMQLRRYETVQGGWLEARSITTKVHLPASQPTL